MRRRKRLFSLFTRKVLQPLVLDLNFVLPFFYLKVRAVSAVTSASSPFGHFGVPVQANQIKYSDLLARYYVSKRQHLLAAHVLVRLAEMRPTDSGDMLTIEQRLIFLLLCIVY